MPVNKIKPRTKRRVEETEPKGAARIKPRDNAKQLPETIIRNGDGTATIVGSSSELVPVAQYASVTLGPVQLIRTVDDPGDDSDQTREYLKSRLHFVNDLVQEVMSEDRAAVEESVRLYNERQAEEEKKREKQS
jgi:hypothetical protein